MRSPRRATDALLAGKALKRRPVGNPRAAQLIDARMSTTPKKPCAVEKSDPRSSKSVPKAQANVRLMPISLYISTACSGSQC